MGEGGDARTCAFGVGCAKSGTHSLTRMFADSVRAAHEPAALALLDLVRRRSAGALGAAAFEQAVAELIGSLDLDLNVSHINGFIVGALYRLYPDARYVLTVRDARGWLDSFVNHTARIRPGSDPVWQVYRDLRMEPASHPHGVQDAPLRLAGLYSLDAYLSYWARHNARVIATIPAERLLIVPTRGMARRADQIAGFLDLPAAAPDREHSHAFAGKYFRTPLERLGADYLSERLAFHTRALLDAARPRLSERAHADLAQAIEPAPITDRGPAKVRRRRRWSARAFAPPWPGAWGRGWTPASWQPRI